MRDTHVERGTAQDPTRMHHRRRPRVWEFPKNGQEYADQVSQKRSAEPCEHGHFGCALWDGGPCANEAQAAWEWEVRDAQKELEEAADEQYQELSLKFEGMEVGQGIRAYDFEPLPGRPDRFIEGNIVRVVPACDSDEGYAYYLVHVTFDSAPRSDMSITGDRRGFMVQVPMETSMDWDGRVEHVSENDIPMTRAVQILAFHDFKGKLENNSAFLDVARGHNSRIADRAGPVTRQAWAHCMTTLSRLAMESDALAQFVQAIEMPSLYMDAPGAASLLYVKAYAKLKEGYDDVIARSGPEACRYSDARRRYTLEEKCIIYCYLQEATRNWSDSLVTLGWTMEKLLDELSLKHRVPTTLLNR